MSHYRLWLIFAFFSSATIFSFGGKSLGRESFWKNKTLVLFFSFVCVPYFMLFADTSGSIQYAVWGTTNGNRSDSESHSDYSYDPTNLSLSIHNSYISCLFRMNCDDENSWRTKTVVFDSLMCLLVAFFVNL